MELTAQTIRTLSHIRNRSYRYSVTQRPTDTSSACSQISFWDMEASPTQLAAPLHAPKRRQPEAARSSTHSAECLTVTQDPPVVLLSRINGTFSSSWVDAHNNSVINNYVDGNQRSRTNGQHFSDGKRKVDYVLVYHHRKRSSHHIDSLEAVQQRTVTAAIVSNGNSVGSDELVKNHPEQQLPGESQAHSHHNHQNQNHQNNQHEAVVIELSHHDVLEEEQRAQREEFERNLMDAGLEMERDPELLSSLEKICAQPSSVVGHPVLFRRSLHCQKSIRLKDLLISGYMHLGMYLVEKPSSLKFKVPTKKMYEVKQEGGLLGKLYTIWDKFTKPLQPKVPQLSENTKMKRLTYPFSREKMHLYYIKDKDTFFDNATRSRIVYEILKRTSCTRAKYSMGITTLIANHVYEAAYPLHDGDCEYNSGDMNDRKLLHREWARYGVFYKYQPIHLVRKYFGEKIGLYFAWLGLYTEFLIPSSVVGVIVFLYGCITIENDVPSQEMCDQYNTFTMCPLCDKVCDYWNLSSACATARASHLFDNPATVFFSVFMALWATIFLEHWKRLQMRLSYYWDLTGLEEEEEHPRPEYETKLLQKRLLKEKTITNPNDLIKNEKMKLTWRDRIPAYIVNFVTILFLITLSFSAVFGVIVYRITVAAALAVSTNAETKSHARVTVTATAVLINLVVVLILDEIYGMVAKWLTELEVPKTEQTFEERLILKAFLLKFVNSYSSIFYVAFFKGRFVGRPGSYVYIFHDYRVEECAPGGCLMELCMQLSIIMLGKQLIQNNIFEIGIPKLKNMYRKMKEERTEPGESNVNNSREPQQWDLDHSLEPFTGLTPEYMEMIIQFGFVTLFVASFPLAPVFALLNNVIEVRLDARKFVTELRRPNAVRAKDIGIWYNILNGIGKFSVIINAFVISVTSDFIPRLVYQYMYSDNGTMHGFINHTLSYFNVSHLKAGTQPVNTQFEQEIVLCRYKDYREPPWSPVPYDFSKQYWAVLAVRLAFVILFQNLVMVLSVVVDWAIPDIPKDISEQIKKEKSLIVNEFLKEEHEKIQMIENLSMQEKQGDTPEKLGRRSRAASLGQFSRKRGSSVSLTSHHTDV